MDAAPYASFLRLITSFLCLKVVLSFNIDVKYPVIKQGPSGSFFGFAVAEHQFTNAGSAVEQWILVSAPKANTTLIQGSIEAGTVFKCSATNSSSVCTDEIPFDKRKSSKGESKNNQWFGVSVKSGGKDQSVLACAHRYLSYGPGRNFNLLEGTCRSMEKDLKVSGDRFNPCSDKNAKESVPSYINYGQCQLGIGTDIIKDSTVSFLFGAVGVENFAGRAYERVPEGILIESAKMSNMELSYFGYSIAHGHYLSKTRKDVAMGGPRSDSTGKVAILKRDGGKMTVGLLLPATEDKVQLASAFGFAVCTYQADAKKPGYAHLLVGAPFYQNEVAEAGIVYLYYRSGEATMKLVSTLGMKIARANFGAAIISPGDLNLDGYNDVIVGAPYENDNTGAIYVFQGSAKGLKTTPSQKIAASTLDSKLRAFGRSLAGGMDLDSNKYNDIVVGAYASDRVAMLRSRPVIKIISSITTSPPKINPDDYLGEKKFRINIKYRYEERSKRLTSEIRATMKLVLDPGRTPRLRFALGDSSVSVLTVKVRNVDSTKRLAAELVRSKDGTFQSFPDVKISLSFTLIDANQTVLPNVVTSLDSMPILESHDGTGKEEKAHLFDAGFIQFKRDCDPCIPNLAIVSSKNLTLRLGRVNVKLDATIINKGPNTAFQTDVAVTLPNRIGVSSIMLSDGALRLCDDAIALPDGTSETKCRNIFQEIKAKKEEKIVIVLDTKRLDSDLDYKKLSINVSSANKEVGTYADNVISVSLSVVAKADLRLQGNAITRREFYGGKIIGESAIKKDTEAGHVLKHRYYVINNGPDKIPSALITINWPYETVSGKHLLYLMDVKSSGANCTFAPRQLNLLRLASSTSSSIDLNMTATGSLSSGRRRRDVSGSNVTTKAPTVNPTQPPSGGGGSTGHEESTAGTKMEGRVLVPLPATK
eukprot:Seg1681.2 transcript_id=Seg1681.2/GoldUCD/mRNA.D3Y31 product="Integrin alpha-9" protein_id=Seg1681.2/GoldUCD/D3Y31